MFNRMPVRFIINLALVLAFSNAPAQESESTTAPRINTFSLDPDARGALGNSVNLFTGDVNLPLNLVMLPGRNGLDVGVNIGYSSNIQNQVDTWNVEAPTGILGLGWSFDFEKIIVDHKNTGSRFDDDFYLIAGGASNLLVRTGTVAGAYEYKTKNYQLWKILCYPNSERWEITREDGTKYVYGGGIGFDGNGQRTSLRNAVQWGVKWGNWIGSSNVTTGQSQFAIAWNISKIQNTWGDSVTFSYDIFEQYVGSTSGKKHTTASYLKTITDVLGRTVKLYYQDKSYSANGPREYQAAHNEHGTTGVYQDKFEARYLDYIAAFDLGGNDTLATTRFAYHPLQYLNGNHDLAKRYLKSITQYITGRKVAPALVFDYYFNPSDTHYGALKTVTYPEGGIVTYSYSAQSLSKSDRRATLLAPTGGSKPRVWLGEDYVVVTWFRDPGYVDIYALVWEGRWKFSGLIQTLAGVQLIGGQQQDFEIFLEKDFFAVVEKYYSDSYDKVVHLLHKHPHKNGNWLSYNSSNYMGSVNQRASFSLGRNFASILSQHSGNLNRYHWNETSLSWTETGVVDLNPGIGLDNSCSASGAMNFLVVSYLNQINVNTPRWYYLDELDNWQQVSGVDYDVDGDHQQALFTGPTFTVLLFETENGHQQWIYRWDENFSANSLSSVSNYTGVDVQSRVGIFESTISVSGIDENKGMRWTGNAWLSQSLASSYYITNSALGPDFIIRRDKSSGAGWIKRFVFTPSGGFWQEDVSAAETGLYEPGLVGLSHQSYGWYTNTPGQSPTAKLYYKLPNGWSNPTSITSWSAYDQYLHVGHGFYVYEDWSTSGQYLGTKIGMFKNGQWSASAEILDDDSYFLLPAYLRRDRSSVLGSTIFTWSSPALQPSLETADRLKLYRILNNGNIGALNDFPVVSLAINDGYQTTTTHYQYDASRALYDPTGTVAQYNSVIVTSPLSYSEGYTKHFFFNGLPASELVSAYPPNDTYTNADSFYSHLRGVEYLTAVYNAAHEVVAMTTKYWKLFRKQLRATDEGAYIRLMKEVSTLDDVEKIVQNTYNSLGLNTETKSYNYNWDGNLDSLTQSSKYWYEAYDTDFSENVFTSVIQTTTRTSTTVTSVSAAAWKEWYTGKWAPHKNYAWDGTGSGDFNFASWSGSGEPSTGWLKTSEIMAVNAEGAVLQTKNVDNVFQSSIHDYPKLRPIAGFTHARISQSSLGSEASFLSFENGVLTNQVRENDYWSFPSLNIISTNAHTGSYSCRLNADSNPAAPVYGPTRDFRPPDLAGQQRKYVLSCWVRTEAGFGPNKGELIIHSKQDVDSPNTVYPNVTDAYVFVPFGDTQGKWQYLEAVIDLKQVRSDGSIPGGTLLRLRCYPANHDDSHYVLIDDLRLSPLDAPFSGTVYEPKYDLATATLGTNGATMRTIYDGYQRPLATVGPNENTTSLTVPYYSRAGNNDAFNILDPNSALSLTARNGGFFDDFNDGDAEGWNIANGAWQVVSGKLKNTGEDAADYAILGSFSASGYYTVSAKVEKISGNDFGLQIGSVLVRWFNKWQLKDGANVIAEDLNTPLTDHWLLITSDKAVLFFADGKLIFKQILGATIFGSLSLYTGGVGTQATFDDIIVFRDPTFARSFVDGAGKSRQSQTLKGLQCQVSETVYDNIGRPAVQTKTAEFSDSLFVFRPGFVTGLNWSNGVMTGKVADYYSFSGSGYSDDESYPYTRQVYEASPLSRVIDSGLPGQDFAVGQGHTARMQYSKNNDGTFVGTTLASGSLPAGQYFLKTGISPDGVYAYSLTDKAGNLIAEKSGPMEGGLHPTTSHEYDDFGRQVRTRLPNYYNPPTTGDWTIHYTYDFFGRLKQKITPDAQATYFYIYDKAGRLRFMIDANGSAQTPDHVQYWKYDALGRTLECGYIVQNWNATTLQNYADTDPSWPSTPATWRKKYTYDLAPLTHNAFTFYAKGQLYKLETNNDSDIASEVEEAFTYDIYGNVITKTAKVLDYNASTYGISYSYDHGGNVTAVTYVPGHVILQNEAVTGIISYSAVDSITAGPGYIVASGASAALQAGQKIRLVPGFAAQSGSYFNARIDPALTEDATVVTYNYDALGRLIGVGKPGDADFYAGYTYVADGRLASEKLANEYEVRNHFYNSPGWLLQINGERFTEDITHTTGWGGAAGYFDGRIKTTS
ncbi:MAG: DUF6443 domain-containing protein, partial [bacterium]